MDRIIVILALFAVGAFAIYKMVTVKPHKLVKKDQFIVNFGDNIPCDQPGREIDCFYARKIVLIPAAVLLCGIVIFLFLSFYESPAYVIGCLLAIPCVSFINSATERIIICENAVVKKNLFREKVYYLRDISRLESYNIISAWSFRGISYGYRFVRGTNVLLAMKVNEYVGLARIEALFGERDTDNIKSCS